MLLEAFRHLQLNYEDEKLSLQASLWFPSRNSPALLETFLEENELEDAVTASLEQLLCEESTDLVLTEQTSITRTTTTSSSSSSNTDNSTSTIDNNDNDSGTPRLQMVDVCGNYNQRSSSSNSRRTRNRNLQQTTAGDTPSILHRTPTVWIEQTSNQGFTWSVWSFEYQVLHVGEIFVEEAIMNANSAGGGDAANNDAGLTLTELAPAAVAAMQEVVQLTLDVNMMEGRLDEIFRERLPVVVYSLPVVVDSTDEEDYWSAAQADFEENYIFQPRTWYPMRYAGIALLVTTIGGYLVLWKLAQRRRLKRGGADSGLVLASTTLTVSGGAAAAAESVQLVTPDGVDQMLHQSKVVAGLMATAPVAEQHHDDDDMMGRGNDSLLLLHNYQLHNHSNNHNHQRDNEAVSSLGAPYGDDGDYKDDDDDDSVEHMLSALQKQEPDFGDVEEIH